MTDYFALLNQPRAPWLDPEKLKETYHQKTLQAHPDAQMNEAYQVLQDPKRRLHHLLSLEGAAPSSTGQAVPDQLQDLFPQIGPLTQRTKLLLAKIQATSNALSRSLLKQQILEVRQEMNEVRGKIQSLSDASFEQLRQINAAWTRSPAEQIQGLSNLYFAFAYLSRWSTQLDEMIFQLSLH